MAGQGHRRFIRKSGTKTYRKIFIIFPEGKTEKNYFESLSINDNVCLKVEHKDSCNSPNALFQSACKYLKRENSLEKYDHEIWLVIDREDPEKRSPDEINDLCNKCKEQGYNVAVSNPIFEYWFLLHFDKGHGVNSSQTCLQKLKKHLQNYQKPNISDSELRQLKEKSQDAISAAEAKDALFDKWPESSGTTVYRLVKKLI